ncbi:MAG: neuraminidase-like domain-containing protein [Flavisolibacter sp.]
MVLNPTTTRAAWIESLSLLSGYDKGDVDQIDQYFNFSILPDPVNLSAYKNQPTWENLLASAEVLRRLGITIDQIKQFIKPVLVATDTDNLRNALKALYDETLWLDTLKQITDKIRPKKRDALVAYLLAVNPDFEDTNDLYDFFMVDSQMEACMPSSRIVLAHSTIQLFVERCLMGAEPEATADTTNDTAWNQWKWMKNYRVWEANRKVFLYPENYIEAELLDDKSYLFDELINESRQNELTEDSSGDLLIRYLEKLDDIAFLEVIATWYQVDTLTMHVFARSKGGYPRLYYYRRFEKETYWTPWEKVDLDITSDLVVAFVRNNRLNLAWAVFSEEPKPTQSSTIPSTSGSTPIDNEKPKKKLKIQLAISEYANGRWKPKKISVDGMKTPSDYTDADIRRDQYNLLYLELTDQIWLFSSTLEGTEEYNTINGIFDIAGCKGYPELAFGGSSSFNDFFPDFKDAQLESQRYDELNRDKTDDLAVRNAISPFSFYQILGRTPAKYPSIPSKSFHITYPLQLTEIDIIAVLIEYLLLRGTAKQERGRKLKIPFGTLLPYFMEDTNHAYVVIPGFYSSKERGSHLTDKTRRTAWNIFTLINNIIALFNKYLALYKANHNLPAVLQKLVQDRDYQDMIAELKIYRTLNYGEHFKNLYHPLICSLRKTLYKDGIPALMNRNTQLQQTSFDFKSWYLPQPVVPLEYPVENIDFKSDGSYSLYNWELFFHTPLLLATQLGNDQKFEEALTWFHYIFNPTGALSGDSPQKYWVTKPFFQMLAADYTSQRIDKLLYRVSTPTSADIDDLHFAIDEWRDKPFKPHVVARYRPMAYMKATVMKYIRHIMNWGDFLFRQDTMESVAQATRCYTLAQRLAGTRPRKIPPIIKPPYENYYQIEEKLDAFGNALIDLENIIPDLSVLPEAGAELPSPPVTLSMLYFCIPSNEDLIAMWDQIDNRLFNIRHCRNIDGVERTLALFAPPIDPGALIRATAAGLDISLVIAGMNAAIPNYRFTVISQKATELIQEVRTLSSSLLQTLEKKDAEDLSLLKSRLDIKLLKAVRDLKKLSIDDAKQQIVVLQKTREVTNERHQYYAGFERISAKEQLNLDKLQEAQDYQFQAQIVRTVAGVLGLIPEMHIGANGFGGSPEVVFQFGGSALSRATNVAADVLSILGSIASFEASRASILGSYDRRFDDAQLQERLSARELLQIDQQIVGSQIRQTMAETDLNNHDVQIDNAQKMDDFMRSKFTNKQLYDWLLGKISSVYFSAYQLAFDFAKKAERCYQHELGNNDTFIGYGYWDSLKKGLQTADQLLHDLKRMETSYYDKNKREYEIPKPVSLSLLDPFALVKLRETGSCDFEIPESLFDMEFAGQYLRRLKSVSISIPCIAGPYTTLGAKLSMISNKYRKNNNPDNAAATGYTEDLANDERFVYNVGAIQSIAIPAGQNESGLFELNFRDDRYLPFEGCGAVSTWRLELPNPAVLQPFDYHTIADVILHLKYTAREGGSELKTVAEGVLKDNLDQIKQQLMGEKGLHIALQLRRDMPNEWNLLKKNKIVQLAILKSRLPYFIQAIDSALIDHVTFIAKPINMPAAFSFKIDGVPLTLNSKPEWLVFLNDKNGIDLDTGFKLSIASQAQLDNLEDLMMLVSYKFS